MITLPCPRCKTPLHQEFYGLCPVCSAHLRKNALDQANWRAFLNNLWPNKMVPKDDD